MKLLAKVVRLIPQSYKNIYHYVIALLSIIWFNYPAKNLKVIGITGTDGKTTTSTLIYQILKSAKYKVALVSTVAAYIGEKEIDTGFHVTAPSPWMLQKLLRKITDMNYEYVVLEATSHGLDQHRLLGTNIKIAVLTNITHEHLDYHRTFENYVKAKAKLFKNVQIAVLNKTDKSYEIIKKYINKSSEIVGYDMSIVPKPVFAAINKKFPEIYNRLNATAAYIASSKLGVKDKDAISAIIKFEGIAGRMEEIKNNKGFRIIVDFAHTPNALEQVLSTLKRQMTRDQRLLSIFGCASERDDDKRPMMGKISGRIADVSIFTAEDPRSEDINKIIDQMETGALKSKALKTNPARFHESIQESKKERYFLRVPERGEAISFAINKAARKGDVVVICGKGHEKSMAYNGIEYPWSDQEAVKLALSGKVYKIDHD